MIDDQEEKEVQEPQDEETTEDPQSDDVEESAPDDEQPPDEESGEEDLVVTLGQDDSEDTEEEDRRPYVKKIRRALDKANRTNKKLSRRIEQLEAQTKVPETAVRKPGPMPSLAECNYDEDLHRKRSEEWNQAQVAYLRAQEKAEASKQAEEQAYQQKMKRFQTMRRDLRVSDADEMISTVEDTLSPTQRGIIIHAAKNPALLFYALGKNPNRLDEISAIEHPVDFSFAVASLEAELKVSKRKPKTKPEKMIGDTGNPTGDGRSLDRLRDANKDSDSIDNILEHRRKLRRRQRAG